MAALQQSDADGATAKLTRPAAPTPPPTSTTPGRHGCPDLCINVVNNMYGYNAMEVQEAFVKIREQVGVCVCVWGGDLGGGGYLWGR